MNETLIPLYVKNFSEMLDDGLIVTNENGKTQKKTHKLSELR